MNKIKIIGRILLRSLHNNRYVLQSNTVKECHMFKEIAVGVSTAITVAVIFYLWGLFETISISVPSNAVIAFKDDECPKVGWKEYTPAYGRFIRGIDKADVALDPDGKRLAGSLQIDTFKEHVHSTKSGEITLGGSGSTGRPQQSGHMETGTKGDKETRPKNVALLYCVKK